MSSPLCSSHASAICPGVAPFRSRDLAHGRRGAHVRVEVLALIARIAAAEVALRIFLGALHRAGEKAAAERRERHEADAELAQQRNDARLEVALPQRVLALQRRDRMHGVRAADRLLARFGEAEEAHLPFAHELGHRADDVLDRHRGIDAMLVEQIDVIGLQPAQRAFDGLADVRRPAVHAGDAAVLVELEAELRRDDDAIARAVELLERAREQLLVRDTARTPRPYRRTCTPSSMARWIVAMDSRSSRSSAVPYAWLIPMRPRPSAETVRPCVPSCR